mgnify:CR=1 FL=1
MIVSTGAGDEGPLSAATQTPGYPLNVFDWNLVLYGVLIIIFFVALLLVGFLTAASGIEVGLQAYTSFDNIGVSTLSGFFSPPPSSDC